MKKKLLFLLMIFLLTGCSGSYEVEIYNDTVIEKATALFPASEVSTEDPYTYLAGKSLEYDANGDFLAHDSKKTIEKDGNKGVELINHYESLEDFKESSHILGYCYIARNVTKTEKEFITLKTSQEFTCMNYIEDLDNVTIALKSNHKLKKTNADEVKGHTYYWYINRENYKNKPISLVLYSDKYVWNYNNDFFKKLGLIIFSIGGTVLLIFGIYQIYKSKEEV